MPCHTPPATRKKEPLTTCSRAGCRAAHDVFSGRLSEPRRTRSFSANASVSIKSPRKAVLKLQLQQLYTPPRLFSLCPSKHAQLPRTCAAITYAQNTLHTAHVTRHALAGSLSLSLRNQLLPPNASKGRSATREHCTEAAVNNTALWFKCSSDTVCLMHLQACTEHAHARLQRAARRQLLQARFNAVSFGCCRRGEGESPGCCTRQQRAPAQP